MPNPVPPTAGEADSVIRVAISDSFQAWMSACGGALAVTTYQAGKVAMLGWDESRRQVTLLLRQFNKPLGLAVRGGALALATRHEVTLFADAPLLARDYLENQPGRYDALYLPRASYHTGDVNVHDIAFGTGTGTGTAGGAGVGAGASGVGASGIGASGGGAVEADLWVVNSRFSCLASLSREFSFVPRWKPPFVSEIAPEDRCHLNGLAMVDGKPGYVTALGETDTAGGWRANKAAGGVIVHVDSNQLVLRGLSMPHSPRWHDGRLWVLNSGAGELWVVDPKRGTHDVVCALPGYLRGLCFVGGTPRETSGATHAVVGLCQIREKHIFGGLPVQQRHPKLLCGVAVIDLRTGRQAALFEFTSGCQELYDVQFIPGVRRPMILNLEREAARQAFTAPDFSYWLRPSAELPPGPKNNT
jgi:uncharacterized protein (TIGR03032 family)